MPIMSYCRFENTLRDFRDCAEHIDDTLEANGTEASSRLRLIKAAYDMLRPYLIYAGDLYGTSIKLDEYALANLPLETD